jgi:DnaJ-class molecular chaperone
MPVPFESRRRKEAARMDAERDRPDRQHPDRTDLPDHYAALQVDPSASQQEIARAYRALMRNLHPDIEGGSLGGAAAGQPGAAPNHDARNNDLLRIMQAFAVLRNPGRRAAYDQSRAGPQAVSRPQAGPQIIPVRHVRSQDSEPGPTIRITPVRWESGPWS